jgi:hypothetical protein
VPGDATVLAWFGLHGGVAERRFALGRFDLRRLGASVLIAGALALIVWGFASAETGDQAVEINDPAIERVLPNPGALVLRQSQVGADLATGYRGILIIDGQEIPTQDAQATGQPNNDASVNFDAVFDLAQNTVLFVPRQGATIEQFSPGEHQVTLVYWKLDESRDSARTFSWKFKVS